MKLLDKLTKDPDEAVRGEAVQIAEEIEAIKTGPLPFCKILEDVAIEF